MRKYGVENFIIKEIEYVKDKKDLNEREIFWIGYYDSTNHDIGYNISAGGGGNLTKTEKRISKVLELWNKGFAMVDISKALCIGS